jgi:hypothetical protein
MHLSPAAVRSAIDLLEQRAPMGGLGEIRVSARAFLCSQLGANPDPADPGCRRA